MKSLPYCGSDPVVPPRCTLATLAFGASSVFVELDAGEQISTTRRMQLAIMKITGPHRTSRLGLMEHEEEYCHTQTCQ